MIDSIVGNTGSQTRAVAAYVTFEEEEGAARCACASAALYCGWRTRARRAASLRSCVREYPNSFLYWLCQPRRKRLNDTRLTVEVAPEPTDIMVGCARTPPADFSSVWCGCTVGEP